MEREYPNFTKDPHDVLFIPEFYLYGKLAEKVSICKKKHIDTHGIKIQGRGYFRF
jgi:hypothetical protein